MALKSFNFRGSEEDFEIFKNNVGNVSAYLSAIIVSKIPKGESSLVSIMKKKLDEKEKEREKYKLELKMLDNDIISLRENIIDEEEKHQELTKKDSIAYARDKLRAIKKSVDSEYNYVVSMKKEGFSGTLEEYLVKEFYDNLK